MQESTVKIATLEPLKFGSALFRTITRTTAELWIFLTLPGARIADCSDSFLSFWNMPREHAIAESVDSTIESTGIATANVPTQNSVPRFDEFVNQVRATVMHHKVVPLLSSFKIDAHVVLDDSGLPLGNLVYLHSLFATDASASKNLPYTNPGLHRLTPRELEVIRRLSEGATNKSISLQLHISIKTVEKHRSSAMKKLNASSFADLIRIVTLSGVQEMDK